MADSPSNNPERPIRGGVQLIAPRGSDIPVLAVLALPPAAVGASYNQIEATIMDPRNASKILKGIAVMAHRQLNKRGHQVAPALMAAALAAVRASDERVT